MKKITTNAPADAEALVVDSMGEAKYRSAEGLNKSLLVPFIRSPKHYLAALNEPKEPTDSMNLGTSLHAELLLSNPETAYAVKKKMDGRTSEGKEYNTRFELENKGKAIINEEQAKHLLGMKNSLFAHPTAHKLLDGMTHRELAVFANRPCQYGNVRLKGMLDGYNENEGIIIDIKTAQDASSNFKWAVKDFRYDLQQVHYTWLVGRAGLPFQKFMFIVVENKPPYGVAVYYLSMETCLKALDEWRLALDFFSKCQDAQDFEIGYPETPVELSI